ncbi:MAG TPA: SH3 domain-containing protein [Thermomicrobiales bacterium]
MDARRFDGLARVLARGRSRRGVLRALAGVTAGAMIGRTEAVLADSEPSGVGGSDAGSVGGDGTAGGDSTTGGDRQGICLPISRPSTAASALQPPFEALITAGTCESPDESETFPLLDVTAEDDIVGAPTAAAVARSVTTVRVRLNDLVNRVHAIIVRSEDDPSNIIACGEIGGLRTDDDLTVGIRERNGSNYTGTAWLRGSNGSTLVYVFLGRGLSTVETAAATRGTKVATTEDVNLRAEPSAQAGIIGVIPAGTELTVTGTNQGEWIPVENPETGDTGWVSARYLVITN